MRKLKTLTLVLKLYLPFLLIFISSFCFGQLSPIDSTKNLQEVTIKGYYNAQPLLRSVSAVSRLDSLSLALQSNSSLVAAMNTLSGVRMEERSPGSYRLSLRGSLLRSPFGIRNVKIYFDDFPLTDAGGNTYLNALDFAAISGAEIFKGPDGSIFGANTGGAVLLSPANTQPDMISVSANAGSYGLFHQNIGLSKSYKNYRFNFTQGYQRSDGYRQNSKLNRKYFQTLQQWDYHETASLKALIFYSDLAYQTPGGLTANELAQNPRLARPATAALPGAVAQQAGIYSKLLFAGLSNNLRITNQLKYVTAIFYNHADINNPFITNYEKRQENTWGLRTFVDYKQQLKQNLWSGQLGLESAQTHSGISNFDNNGGTAGNLNVFDKLKANQTFAFFRLNGDINHRFLVELASSINFYRYRYRSEVPAVIDEKTKKFKAQWMPKVALSYLIDSSFTLRASISKGYSPPTIAEVRSSDNNINSNLQAELGWNYEGGIRYQSTNRRFYANANWFIFNLNDAIVRRLNNQDQEFFINAGGTKQTGLELESRLILFENRLAFFKSLTWQTAYTYSHFKFSNFISGSNNFSGNQLTGVPNHNVVTGLALDFAQKLYLFLQHQYTSRLPLNDANTVFAKYYHLLDAKLGINNLSLGRSRLNLFFGLNNIFNQQFSLGNDLNAVNGRYYNPAMGINFYSGITVKF